MTKVARLPEPNSDVGVWGDVLNDFLSVELNADGSLKKAAAITQAQATADAKYTKPSAGIPESDLTLALQTRLDAGTTLDSLSDVNTSGAADGNALVYSNGAWAPAAVSSGNGGTVPADNSISTAKLTNGAVTAAKIADATITNTQISTSAAIAQSKISGLTAALDAKATASDVTTALSTKADASATATALNGKASSTHTHAASDITSGVLTAARLGSGTASATTFLRGDGSWQTPSASAQPLQLSSSAAVPNGTQPTFIIRS